MTGRQILFSKKSFLFGLLALFCVRSFCLSKYSTNELFYSYLKNDPDLKNYMLELEKAKLEYDGTAIEKGVDLTLSTGTVTLKTADGGTKLEAKPSLSVSIPAASGLTLSASGTETVTENSSSTKDLSLAVGISLISEETAQRKLALEKARRSVLEAERNLKNEGINSENEFYSYLKDILEESRELVELQLTLYDDTIDFEKKKAQGYAETSSTYRLAQLKVVSDEHDIETARRELLRDYMIFYKECGLECDFTVETDFLSLVPEDIQTVTALDIESFSPDSYDETEEAIWNHKINKMERAASKTFTLGLSGGYTFDNSNTGSDTADAGLSSTIGGLSLYGGVSLPVDGSANPSYTASATLKPNTFRKNKITKKKNSVSEEIELLAIETSRKNLGTTILASKQTLSDIQWEKESNRQNYEMYEKLEKELAVWYEQGLITESEYLSAKTNAQKYKLSLVINDIEMIIYNDDVSVMFTEQL